MGEKMKLYIVDTGEMDDYSLFLVVAENEEEVKKQLIKNYMETSDVTEEEAREVVEDDTIREQSLEVGEYKIQLIKA